VALAKYVFFTNVATGSAGNPAAIRVGGWSFTVYDTTLVSPDQKRLFRVLCEKYAELLPSSGVVVAQRYQNLDPLGPSGTELMRFPGVAGTDNDYPSMALYCRVAGEGVANTRPMYIRGVPDDMIKKGEFVPTPAYERSLKAFNSELAGWNFKARDKSQPNVAIYNIESDGTVTTEVPLTGVVNGSIVRLLRVKAFDSRVQLKKTYKVEGLVSESQFKLKGWTEGVEAGGGSIRLNAYVYPNIPANGVTVGRIVSKKPGAPFDLFRGRASAHRS